MFDFQTAEYCTVGCILIDLRCLPMVREQILTPEAFSSQNCREAFRAACELSEAGELVDPVTVGRRAELSNAFLAECMELVPSCSGAAQYAKTVMEGYRRRQLTELADRIHEGSLDISTDTDQLLTEARASLDAIAEGGSTISSPAESLGAFLKFRSDVNEGKRSAILTGFPSVDGILGGFAQSGLYIIAARPGVGKSALGIAMADMIAKERRVLYVSLEMSEEELNARRVAAFSEAPCTFGKLLFGHTTQEEDTAVINACGVLNERKLHISAVSGMTVAQLGNLAQNVKAEVLVVDYLGLLSASDRNASEYDRITRISGDLKRLAKRLQCVVLALCQLNRESAGGSCNIPKLSQLRSSGAIEQDADGVLLLRRPEYEQKTIARKPEEPQQFFVDIAKNRHGRTGTAELAWYAPVNRFEDRSGKWTVKSWR